MQEDRAASAALFHRDEEWAPMRRAMAVIAIVSCMVFGLVTTAGIATVRSVRRHETELPVLVRKIEAERGDHQRTICVRDREMEVDELAGKELIHRVRSRRVAD